MKIALYSDLHLDLRYGGWKPPALDVDLVILAGDIGSHTHGLEWAADAFRQAPVSPDLLYIVGNHEYYGAHLGLLDELRNPRWARMGVRVLERNAIVESGVRILGSTLWSAFDLHGTESIPAAMKDAERGINDYQVIRTQGGQRLSALDTLRLHRKAVGWLDTELAKPFDGKTIVVTHFAPHRGCVAPQHQGGEFTPYFTTDLAWLMEKHRIDLWCYGHTHTNSDFIAENGCRVVSNQLGYANESDTGFRPDLVIEI